MQEFGDSVAVLSDEEATPGALREEIARLKQREVDLDHGMLPKIARRRYLDGLKDANLTEEGCLICANTEQGQSRSLPLLVRHSKVVSDLISSGPDTLWTLHARGLLADLVLQIRFTDLSSLSRLFGS